MIEIPYTQISRGLKTDYNTRIYPESIVINFDHAIAENDHTTIKNDNRVAENNNPQNLRTQSKLIN